MTNSFDHEESVSEADSAQTSALTRAETPPSPEVLNFLTSMGNLKHERDSLRLELEQTQRALAVTDAKLQNAERACRRAMDQRDSLIARMAELTTHFSTIRHCVDAARETFEISPNSTRDPA